MRIWALLLAAGVFHAAASQEPGPDLAALLVKADQKLEEARTSYEDAKAKSEVAGFVEASFKLEEARIKYLVLQEVGNAEQQKTGAERLRVVQQLTKLINDAKIAIAGRSVLGPAASEPAPAPPPAPAPAPTPEKPDASPAPAPAPVLARLPAPGPEALKTPEKLVKDLFKEQYAKKAPEEREALARALLGEAAKTKDDPSALYVLYREGGDVAAQACEVTLALFAADEMARVFDVDGAALRQALLAACAKNARAPADAQALAEAYLKLVDERMDADDYEAADKLMSAATAQAKKANVAALAPRVSTKSKELSEAKSAFNGLKGHLATLAKTPEHPGANLGMGQYLCFVKASWDLGVRFLAQGSDATMKALALKEMSFPTEPGELSELADGWSQLAEKERSALKKGQMIAHARELYEASLPAATGLLKAKIQKRLDTLGPAPVSGGPVDLLVLIDASRDAVAGGWKMDAGVLQGDAAKYGRIQIPYLPPEEYDLVVTAARGEAESSPGFGLVHKDSQFAVVVDTWAPKCLYGIDNINNVDAWMNESTGGGRQLHPDKPVTFEFRVRKTGVTALANGKQLIKWSGDYAKLKVSWRWPMPNKKLLFVGHYGGPLRYSKIVLTPVSGRGKRLR